MVPRDNEYIEEFDNALEAWIDNRFVSKEDIRALSMFSVYLVNLAEEDGWTYDGHSFKIDGPWCCLVVKGTVESIPQVVFTSAPTHTGCVKHFLKKMREDGLKWREDKFRS